MASEQHIRRRSSVADRTQAASIAAAATTASTFAAHPKISRDDGDLDSDAESSNSMPPPPPPAHDVLATRSARATSFASRNANRLSLTLPIAHPSSDPSRPTPALSSNASIPPTPLGTPAPATPASANDFIIAVAAQERRVLELKEELARAESDLALLKKQWASQESHSRKADSKRGIHARPAPTTPVLDDEASGPRTSMESDLRRSMLLQTQNTPGSNRRRVLRGGHARTLSLLSPLKTDAGLGLHGEPDQDGFRQPFRFPPPERMVAQPPVTPNLSKRSSWQPQTQLSQTNVPGLVEDFRLGLKAFVEDIRQITVGDEPITGQSSRYNVVSPAKASPSGQDTIRASNSSRAKVDNLFDSPTPSTKSAAAATKSSEATPEKTPSRRNKHFSWTPLSFDSLDDNAWTSWESPPASVKSTRWSGSTINSSRTDDSEAPEMSEEDGLQSKVRTPGADATAFNPKLGELLPNVVNKLSPSNIKRTANQLMDEWERSLVEPSPDKENNV
ncbi:unnamed protein product [Clonostachys rosea f. rosea IK726]|uniref:DUF4048 domain-containing protein n=2 Tax=Bionectria ochroleuca TaxID=29856 RepID=A0A0B7KDB1_BIOOC|nr:unnamed protein product [Clonostachys rosea f. rosea IK726]